MCFRPTKVEVQTKCHACGTFNPPALDKCKKCGADITADKAKTPGKP
jgi:ribosomal protein L40E